VVSAERQCERQTSWYESDVDELEGVYVAVLRSDAALAVRDGGRKHYEVGCMWQRCWRCALALGTRHIVLCAVVGRGRQVDGVDIGRSAAVRDVTAG